MKLFTPLYDACLSWAQHRHADKYLAGLSFTESVIFPIPPDVMLAPMALATPKKAWWYAMITTIASVIGGIAGYLLGYFAFDAFIHPIIVDLGYSDKLALAMDWFTQYGVWVVFIAGFSPIPYKVFTLTAGMMSMAFFAFRNSIWGGSRCSFFFSCRVDVLGRCKNGTQVAPIC